MKEFTAMRLAEYCKPTVSYVLNAMDLSVLTGYEHEAWNLGDYVRVEDKELGLSVTTRIVRREYNLQEPWNTVLELSTTLKNLGSSVSTLDTIADSLEGTSVVSENWCRSIICVIPVPMMIWPIGSIPALRQTVQTVLLARHPLRL